MLLAEFLGTMFLVFVGCASTVDGWDSGNSPHLIEVAIAFGITIATMAQAIGHVSGCHINPAVTSAMLVTGKITVIRAIFYILSQCVGAICGAALLQALTPASAQGMLGVTQVHNNLTTSQGFGVEFFSTFTLVLIVFGVCDEHRKDIRGSAPLAIGLAVTTAILATGRYTGGSLNPARSLGPAVVANQWAHHWVYWAGPIVGGMVAALIYQKAFRARSPEEEQELEDYQYRIANAKEREIIADRTTTI
jgi:aquaporin related protein